MSDEPGGPQHRTMFTLHGDRFDGGRLPLDALPELAQYQAIVRAMAHVRWRAKHGAEAPPASLDADTELAIIDIEDGSAGVVLAFLIHADETSIQAEALRDTETAIIETYSDGQMSPDLDESVRPLLMQLGVTLAPSEFIEVRDTTHAESFVAITPEARSQVVAKEDLDHLLLSPPDETSHVSAAHPGSLVGKIIEQHAEKQYFLLKTADGTRKAFYKSTPDLKTDVKAILDTAAEGPVMRVTGSLQWKYGKPYRFMEVDSISQFASDDTPWGRTLAELAMLPDHWDASAMAAAPSFVALDAAHAVLGALLPGVRESVAIFPTEDGGVAIEWASPDRVKSVEILPDGTFYLYSRRASDSTSTFETVISVVAAAQFANEGDR